MPEVSPIEAEFLGRVHEIDVSGETNEIYVQRGAVLELRNERRTRPWHTAAEWSEEVDLWQGYVRSGGAAFGAFEDDRFLGFSVLRIRLDEETAQLAGLYVDLGWRRHGLGRALVSCVIESARGSDATKLYVSSSRYKSAVDFYLSLGFRPLETADPELFRMEPHDIHMSLSI